MNHRSRPGSIKFTDQMARTLFNALSAHIAIIDEDGTILETNRAWQAFASKNGMTELDHKHFNYFSVCDSTKGEDIGDAVAVANGIRRVINRKTDEFLYDYPCHSPEGKHWYYLRAVRMDNTPPIRVVVSHEDITALKSTEEELRINRDILSEKNQSLEETNIALKVLLKQRELDKIELEQKFLSNLKNFVLPYINKLENASLSSKDRTLVTIIKDHISDIISPMMQRLTNAGIILTPQEMQVATLIKDGKTSKEIAEIMFISESTVNFHRKNLRIKFGLRNKKGNLRSYLLSIS